MDFKQFYLGCLSYVRIILARKAMPWSSPQRDVQQYLDEAESAWAKDQIRYRNPFARRFSSAVISNLLQKPVPKQLFQQRAGDAILTHKVKDGDELNVGKIKAEIFSKHRDIRQRGLPFLPKRRC